MSKPTQARKKVNVFQAYQAVFNSPNGQIVLKDLMAAHHLLGTTFSENSNQMILKEGERNAVLRILSILKVDVTKMLERIEQNENDVE